MDVRERWRERDGERERWRERERDGEREREMEREGDRERERVSDRASTSKKSVTLIQPPSSRRLPGFLYTKYEVQPNPPPKYKCCIS